MMPRFKHEFMEAHDGRVRYKATVDATRFYSVTADPETHTKEAAEAKVCAERDLRIELYRDLIPHVAALNRALQPARKGAGAATQLRRALTEALDITAKLQEEIGL